LGTGRSTRPAGANYSLSAQAARVAAVLDTLGERDVLLIAHSISASTAFRLAARRPDLVRGIVSLDGGAVETVGNPSFRRALRLAPLLRLVGGHARIRREVASAMRTASGDPSWVTEEVIDAYLAPAAADLDGTIRAYRAMAGSREAEPLHSQLGAIRVPVLVLLGAGPKDVGLLPHDAVVLGTQIRLLRLETLPGVGHYVHEERPAAVAAAVARLSHLTTPGRAALVTTP
jgi:magnesium chelatase accessory protein